MFFFSMFFPNLEWLAMAVLDLIAYKVWHLFAT